MRKTAEWGGLLCPGAIIVDEYGTFIESKSRVAEPFGFEPGRLNAMLFNWQADVTGWSARRGRAALFEECGLGKTPQQLEWAHQVVRHTNGKVLIHCPVGVRAQTAREAEKFGIPDVHVVDEMSQVKTGILLVNYEKLHLVDTSQFAGVVLDESSILKSYTGKTKQQLISQWKHARYKLACTATPAPNDHMELGNHAEFLGIMPSNEMLSRWFINDTMRAGGYRLRRHAQQDFWQWMASWAVSIEKPSDIGGDDEGFRLPELKRFEHVVEESDKPPPGMLFNNFALNATNVHKQKRSTTEHRAEKVAELVEAEPDRPWLIWCDTNYEADALVAAIDGCVDVRGSDPVRKKEESLLAFSEGEVKRLISKPTICGFGMNWQHCDRMAFVGLSYSFEQYYQAVRRCWRFGQQRPVHVHVIMSEGEEAITNTVKMKEKQHATMSHSMAKAMRQFTAGELHGQRTLQKYHANKQMELPKWIA